MVVGDVPTYYYDGKGNPVGNAAGSAPSLALPNIAAGGAGAGAGTQGTGTGTGTGTGAGTGETSIPWK